MKIKTLRFEIISKAFIVHSSSFYNYYQRCLLILPKTLYPCVQSFPAPNIVFKLAGGLDRNMLLGIYLRETNTHLVFTNIVTEAVFDRNDWCALL